MRISTNAAARPARGAQLRNAANDGSGDALERSKETFVKDFHHLIDDGEALLKSTSNLSGEALAQAQAQFRATLADARTHLDDVFQATGDRGRQAVRATDRYVHERPWPAIGAAAGLGMVLGFLL